MRSAPVASFNAGRIRSGLTLSLAEARSASSRLPLFDWGATSVGQIAVSAASIWQKSGRKAPSV